MFFLVTIQSVALRSCPCSVSLKVPKNGGSSIKGEVQTSSTTAATFSRFLNNLIGQSGRSGTSDWLKGRLR